jgi:ankyrin repeat protein
VRRVLPLLLAALAACGPADTPAGREERLLRAAREGDLKTISSLLDKGVDIEARNPGDGWTPLFWAAVRERADAVALLRARGARIEVRDRRGLTALMAASRWGRKAGVAALLDAGAKIDARDVNGWTALMWAAFKGQADMAAFLLSRGANPRITDPDGRTALDLAVLKRHDKAAALLRGPAATASSGR